METEPCLSEGSSYLLNHSPSVFVFWILCLLTAALPQYRTVATSPLWQLYSSVFIIVMTPYSMAVKMTGRNRLQVTILSLIFLAGFHPLPCITAHQQNPHWFGIKPKVLNHLSHCLTARNKKGNLVWRRCRLEYKWDQINKNG